MDIFSNGLRREFDCACGKRHVFSSKVYDGSQFEDALLNLLPRGSHVLYVGCDPALKKRLGRLYRVTATEGNPSKSCGNTGKENAEKDGIQDGKEDNAVDLNNENLGRFNSTGCTAPRLTDLDDVRLVVSDGEAEYAKYIAKQTNVRHVILGGGNLTEYAFVGRDGFVSLTRCGAPDIFCEDSAVDCAAGFADAALTALSLFEWNAAAITRGERPCQEIFKEALKTSGMLLKAAKQYPRQSAELKAAVLETRLRLAVLSGYLNSPDLIINGAAQSAAAMTRLFWQESRQIKPFAVTALLLSPLVARTYTVFLQQPIGFCAPPDNNLRAGRLNEFLGIEEGKAQSMMPPYLPYPQLEHIDYRLNLYREELLIHANETALFLDEAVHLFFRLCDDDGFSFKNYADSLDTSLCMGLGSDIMPGATLLEFMRHKGVLDKYVL